MKILCLTLSLTLGLQAFGLFGQTSRLSASSPPDEQAQQVLSRALAALGGSERIRSISSILIRTKGREHRSAEAQGYDPEKETDTAHEEIIVAYVSQEKFLYEHRTGRHDGTFRWRRWAYDNDQRTVADFVVRFAGARRYEASRVERARRARRIPHLLLLEAEKNSDHLSSLGSADYLGRKHEIISFQLPGEKTSVKLFIDAATHLLSKYEFVMDFPSFGDTTVEYVYAPYRKHERLGWFPTGDAIKVGGKVYREVAYTSVEVDSPLAAAQFELPEDLKPQLAMPGSITEVARGVFLVNSLGNVNPMFVEFKDFVFAVEAPAPVYSLDTVPADAQTGASTLSEELIRKIKERLPGKPIKYFVATHSHSDHGGGARAFVAEGATVLTTPGNKGYFERMMAARQTLAPDRLAREPRPLRLETFQAKRVITDGERSVELIDVGANPHTSESIVVYLPREKLMFQGDLFYYEGESSFPPRDRSTVMSFFARWLISSGLAPERIYGAHGTGYATMEHIKYVLDLSNK